MAKILTTLTDMRIPWLFDAPAYFDNQVSVLHMDEYIALMALPGVQHTKGVQCPFGALSSKPTSWVHFMVDMDDMPSTCPHPMRRWYCDIRRHRRTVARHAPTTGAYRYTLTPPSDAQIRATMANLLGSVMYRAGFLPIPIYLTGISLQTSKWRCTAPPPVSSLRHSARSAHAIRQLGSHSGRSAHECAIRDEEVSLQFLRKDHLG